MYEVTLSIKLLFMLCMWNPAFSLDLDLMDIIKTVHQSPLESGDVDPQQKKDFNPADGTMLQKLFTRLNSINKNMEELKQLQKQTLLELTDIKERSCKSNSDYGTLAPFPSENKTQSDSQTNLIQNKIFPAMRCSSYRALDEFMPVEKVTSNEMLIEAGWDAIYGPMYYCHAHVDVNGIKCRLYGKGNRRHCWVTLPTGREHKVDEKFQLLRKPSGVNVEWRSDWPVDWENVPILEKKNRAGVPHEWAVWDIYTCGLAPRFYFGRCDINGTKIPGLIHSNQKNGLTYTFGGKQRYCSSYEVLVCINK